MQLVESSLSADFIANTPIKKLLIVGPKPPPIGGSPLTVQAMLDELAKYTYIQVTLINTSPSTDPRKKMTGFKLEKVRRIIFIITKYIREIERCDAVLVFANNLFAFTIGFILFLLARHFQKSFYVKPVGGDLDLYLAAQWKPFRKHFLRVLSNVDGALVQTRLLQEHLIRSNCTKVHYLPGCRPWSQTERPQNRNSEELRLIFLSHIHREKGPLVLIEALQLLAQENNKRVSCDFYGPIHDEIRKEFLDQLEATPKARYCGEAAAGTGSNLIAAYDVLVLPTYFGCEGHPGVIIEAMHAGVPVITTKHRAVPELVTNGENGILVTAKDSNALAEAIKQIALDSQLRKRMGEANYLRGQEFRTDLVTAQMLKIIFPE